MTMPTKARVEAVPERTEQQERERLLNQAYGAAQSRLRGAHKDEFNGYYSEEAASRGIEWSPKLSPEQKAERDMRELLAEFPHLAELLREPSAGEVAPG